MRARCATVVLVVVMLVAAASGAGETGFRWSTFFFEDYLQPGEEAAFEFISVVECAGLGAWFGGLGGAIGGLACGLTGWA